MKKAWLNGIVALGLLAGSVAQAQVVTRGPYLQLQTHDSIIVRWRTSAATDSVVRFGTSAGSLAQSASVGGSRTDHSVEISGLSADTRYYYSVGHGGGALAGDDSYHFSTAPLPGTEATTRVWVIGDSGTANDNARNVRDAFKTYSAAFPANLWLMLGDNAYTNGTDAEYQAAVFDTYPQLLRTLPLFSTLGNHDGLSADSATQSGPYFDIFDLPAAGEVGGLASGTEAYYSFDYANIHFICLNSYDEDRSVGGVMLQWLESDLMLNTQPWVIAFWHHPPYSKGSHNSDTSSALRQMRQNALPLLEAWGVDLVLSGHSHSFERSYLLDSHYGTSDTLDPVQHVINPGDGSLAGTGAYAKPDIVAMEHAGAVYTVAGSSGKTSGGALDHPAMLVAENILGSVVIDVSAKQLDAIFIDDAGTVIDEYTLLKIDDQAAPSVPQGLARDAGTDSTIALSWQPSTDNVAVKGYKVFRDNALVTNTVGAAFTDTGLSAATSYDYEVSAFDATGNGSARSAPLSATTDDPATVLYFVASGEDAGEGTVSGDYTATHLDDGAAQSIRERENGGRKTDRYSYLRHTWVFNVSPGSSTTLFANAWNGGSGEDKFDFYYSTDNASFTLLFTVSDTETGNVQSAVLPVSPDGTVWIRVMDSDQTPGQKALDTVYVDHLYLRVDGAGSGGGGGGGGSEATLTLSGSKYRGRHVVDLAWSGLSGSQVDIHRSGRSTLTVANSGEYSDNTGNNGSATYGYQVCEAGTSTCTPQESITF